MRSLYSLSWRRMLTFMHQLAHTAVDTVHQQFQSLFSSFALPRSRALVWNTEQANRVQERLRRQISELELQRHLGDKMNARITYKRYQLSRHEREIVNHIERTVRNLNRSNITRTVAYGRSYQAYPELHWALLAHMVSRNGGYNMTDLKGNLLPAVMDGQYRIWAYRLLERCNALIFQDAYPQLMLYVASKNQGRSLFHLLPQFQVSSFMIPFWESFWIQPNSPLLTVALIINEQNVIEGRVVQKEQYLKRVIERKDFTLHSWLQMNQVVFPAGQPNIASPVPLYGLTLERFDNLKERIAFGKQLYTMLFGIPEIHAGALSFMMARPHTGSRADYWPHRFTSMRSSSTACTLSAVEALEPNSRHLFAHAGHPALIYSPKLKDAWRDNRHEPIESGDWLRRDDILHELYLPSTPLAANLTNRHELMWSELTEIAALALSSPSQ